MVIKAQEVSPDLKVPRVPVETLEVEVEEEVSVQEDQEEPMVRKGLLVLVALLVPEVYLVLELEARKDQMVSLDLEVSKVLKV